MTNSAVALYFAGGNLCAASNLWISGFAGTGGGSPGVGAGIIVNSDETWVSDCFIEECGIGIYLEVSQESAHIRNNTINRCEVGGIVGTVSYAQIIHNVINDSFGDGIALDGADEVVVMGSVISEPDHHGISLLDCAHVIVTDNDILNPGQGADNTYDGIHVGTGSVGSDDNLITNNLITPAPSSGNQTRYGINVVAGSDRNVVHANSLGDTTEYGTNDFNDAGTGTITHPGSNGQFNTGSASLAAAPGIISFSQAGTLSVGSGTFQFPFPFDATLVSVIAAVAVAPTGDDIILDVDLNGTSIYPTATKPTIVDASEVSALAPPDTTAVSAGDLLTVNIDQVGSGTAGEDLTVAIHYQ